ncbi:MAG: sulfatase-like hydrolase/transferase [Planctomycetota bacterium]
MTDRPNVLLITSDQHLFDALGYKNPHLKTPNLDRLRAGGADFTRAYCPNPTCTPTRASIITGMYPAWHGAWSLGTKLMEDVPVVGDVFRAAGYDASLIGKAHFQPLAAGDTPEQESIERHPYLRDRDFWRSFNDERTPWYGFNHVETCRNHTDEAHAGGHYALWMEDRGLSEWEDHFESIPGAPEPRNGSQHHTWTLPEDYHYSVWTADRTIASIERATVEGKPFFCWSSFHDPHPSYLVSKPWDTMYDPADMPIGTLEEGELDKMPPPHRMTQDPNADWSVFKEPGGHGVHGYQYHGYDEQTLRADMAIYYGMTSLMDREIGRILDHLDATGQAENTLIVFTTDHGHYLGHHGLKAKGAFHYEEGIKLPFIARWPGRIEAGSTIGALQSLVDLPQTFLAACGIAAPGQMQGVDQLAVWTGERGSARDVAICEFRHQPTKVHLRTYITERYKLTVYRDRDWGELFDLVEDPGERCNRFDDPDCEAVKRELMAASINEELRREPTPMPRVMGA